MTYRESPRSVSALEGWQPQLHPLRRKKKKKLIMRAVQVVVVTSSSSLFLYVCFVWVSVGNSAGLIQFRNESSAGIWNELTLTERIILRIKRTDELGFLSSLGRRGKRKANL